MKQLTLFFITFLLLTTSVKSQINIKTYTSATDTFFWKKYIHVPKPDKLNLGKISRSGQGKNIERFMAKYAPEYPQFTNDSIHMFTPKDWKQHLYSTDINNDGKTDIIFSGSAGGESDIIRIYMNVQDSFALVFEDYQYLTKFQMVNKKLSFIQTGDVGCCDEYLYFTRDYQVNWEAGIPIFIKGKQTAIYKFTEEPLELLPEKIPFIAVSDTLFLRASAARLNEPYNPYLENFGNIVAKYRQKANGNILAKKTTGKGDHWYFVEMTPGINPSASIFYKIDKIPTFLRGWVHGESISTVPIRK